MAGAQRDAVSGPTLSPPWLCGYNSNGQRYMYSIGMGMDLLLEKMNEAMKAKCPGLANDSALPYQAADRLLVQGTAELNSDFILRLQNAFTAWSVAGSVPSVMGQLQAYLQNLQIVTDQEFPEMTIVGGNAATALWDTLYFSAPLGDPPSHVGVSPSNWDWDGEFKQWRNWLVLYMHLYPTGQTGSSASVSSTGGSGVPGVTSGFATITGLSGMTSDNVGQYMTISGAATAENNGTFQIVSFLSASSVIIANTEAVAPDANNGTIDWIVSYYPYIAPGPVWGAPEFVWGDSLTWGLEASPLVFESIRNLVKRWKSAGTYYDKIIISFGGGNGTSGNEFSPWSTAGAGNPDGTWGGLGKTVNGVVVPTKEPLNPFTAFCDGTALAVSCYEKNIG